MHLKKNVLSTARGDYESLKREIADKIMHKNTYRVPELASYTTLLYTSNLISLNL